MRPILVFLAVSCIPQTALAAQLRAVVTATEDTAGMPTPGFRISNLSGHEHEVSRVMIDTAGTGIGWDYVSEQSIELPPDGTATILANEESTTNPNNGCLPVIEYGLTGIDPGESFFFEADPEPGEGSGCLNRVQPTIDLFEDNAVEVTIEFDNGTVLTGSDWRDLSTAPDNLKFELTLARSGEAVPFPAWGSWFLTVLLLAAGGFAGAAPGMRDR